MRENESLPRTAEGDRTAPVRDLERPEEAEREAGPRRRCRSPASLFRPPTLAPAREQLDRSESSLRGGPAPRSTNRMPSTAPARWTSSDVTRISPAEPRAQKRAARFKACSRPLVAERNRLPGVQTDPDTRASAAPPVPRPRPPGYRAPHGAPPSPSRRPPAPRLPRTSTTVPVCAVDALAGDREEAFRHIRRGLIAVRVAQGRVPAEVGDQERPDHGPISITQAHEVATRSPCVSLARLLGSVGRPGCPDYRAPPQGLRTRPDLRLQALFQARKAWVRLQFRSPFRSILGPVQRGCSASGSWPSSAWSWRCSPPGFALRR